MSAKRWLLLVCFFPAVTLAQFPFLRSLEVRPGQRRPHITHLVQDELGLLWTGSDLGVIRTDGEREVTLIHTEGNDVTAMHTSSGQVFVALTDGRLWRCTANACDTLLVDSSLAAAPVRSITTFSDGTVCLGTYGNGVWFIKDNTLSKLTFAQGLPDDHVNDLAMLDVDRLVVATDQGVAIVSADGVEEVFDEGQGAPDNLIMAVAVTANGTVLAGTDGAGVFAWKPGSHRADPLLSSWVYGPITDIALDAERTWVGTASSGVLVFDHDASRGVYHEPAALDDAAITGLFPDSEGAMWWCDGSDHVHRADPAVLVVPEHEGLDLRQVSALCVDGQDRIWVATPAGIHHHPAGFSQGRHLTRIPVDIDPRTPVVSLTATRNGTIWAATFGSGVLAIAPSGQVSRYSTAQGLHNENVLAARAWGDSVWFATLDGASLWDGERFHRISGTGGFSFDVLPMSSGHVLVATDGEGVVDWDKGSTRTVNTTGRTFYSLAQDDGGSVWALGPGTGLCRLTGQQPICVGSDSPALNGDLFALGSMRGRLLAIGSAGTVALDPLKNIWTDLSGRIGTVGIKAELNALARSSDGSVWFACDRGLYRLRLTDRHFNEQIPVVITEVLVNGEARTVDDVISTTHDRNDITIRFTGLYYPDPGELRFEYRLGPDGQILRTRDRELAFVGLAPGQHRIQLRAFIGEPTPGAEWRTLTVEVSLPWWREPGVIALAMLLLGALIIVVVRARERRMRDRERMEQEKVRFQLQALKSQVDPHFLFNSFNTLVALIETDQEKAVEHVDDLSTFFRNILLVRDKDLIPLTEEVELLRIYFGLEQRRFGTAIDLFVNIPGDASPWNIVPLTLQLLVENALKHNTATTNDPFRIEVVLVGDELVVRNPIRPRTTAAKSTGFGLDSIIKRYAALTSRSVVVRTVAGRFEVSIPLLPRHEDTDR